jgi:hypothetical protein
MPEHLIEMVGATLESMGEVLNWNFRLGRASAMGGSIHVSLAPETVRADKSWQDVLLAPALADTVFFVYNTLRHMFNTELPRRSRHILIQVWWWWWTPGGGLCVVLLS